MGSLLLYPFALIDGGPVHTVLGIFNRYVDAVGRIPPVDDARADLLSGDCFLSVFNPSVARDLHARNERVLAVFAGRVQLVMPVAAIRAVVSVHDEGLDSSAGPDVAERTLQKKMVWRPAAILVPGPRAWLARLRFQRLAVKHPAARGNVQFLKLGRKRLAARGQHRRERESGAADERQQ